MYFEVNFKQISILSSVSLKLEHRVTTVSEIEFSVNFPQGIVAGAKNSAEIENKWQ